MKAFIMPNIDIFRKVARCAIYSTFYFRMLKAHNLTRGVVNSKLFHREKKEKCYNRIARNARELRNLYFRF